jgi:hypothetical protein
MSDIEFFTINKNPKSLVALKYWLKKHNYNTWTTGNADKNGNPIIPIRWDWKPDSDWGKVDPATGIIVIKDDVPVEDVVGVLRKGSK